MSTPLYYITNFLFPGMTTTSTTAPPTTDIGYHLVPVGTILMYTGTTAPANYIFCNGAELTTQQYPNLFSVIRYTYGTGSGTNFRIPNLQKRFPIGADNQTNMTVNYQGSNNQSSGNSTIQSNQLADHQHTPPSGTTGFAAYLSFDPGTNMATSPNGPNLDFNNRTYNTGNMTTQTGVEFLPPFLTINYIIKHS